MDLSEATALRQQRSIKQTNRFLRKDSADLLPLDGLKKLGTSKEGQPHNILQRRLLEATLSRNRLNNRNVKPSRSHMVQSHSVHSDTQADETDLIQVMCQCFGMDMMVTIDTGCTLNLISSVSVEKLGVLLILKSRCWFLEILYGSKSILLENMKMKSQWNKRNIQISTFLSHLSKTYLQRKLV
ncbi:nuclear receptor-interacting protein 3 isoform X3 [Pangasianodon hypophthalmus]|uniref:nuclear receptor-interacting protein 3 isoform X3 n=1 Tax=Pangasianodon hypophthalmus TaxID=310915 RepID=UPI002307231C|nr:nuclear receptor-interacting protein 3 isoform X3 [Pangasianodon hypophthalmus]